VLAIFAAACGSNSTPTSPGSAGGPIGVTVTGQAGARPTITISDQSPPTTLRIQDVVVGSGQEAVSGETVTVQYVGMAWSTRKEFDASWDAGQPYGFALGAGRVIQGWDQGVAGMKVGGRRILVIPPDLGYGAEGYAQVIGPNETLVFVVDLVSLG